MKNNPAQRVSSFGRKRKNFFRDYGVSVAGESAGLEMRVKQLQSRSCSPSVACQKELCRKDAIPGLDGRMWRKQDSMCSASSFNRSS